MPNLSELMLHGDYPTLAQRLLDFSFDEWKISGNDLEKQPKHCLDVAGVKFRKSSVPNNPIAGQCEFGRYDEMSEEIILFPATTRQRDAFTLMHEFAHHVQAYWEEWNEELVNTQLKPEVGQGINEHVADSFAGLIVACSGNSNPDASDLANWMTRTYIEHDSCSMQAMLYTTAETITNTPMLLLIDDTGRVIAGKSYDKNLAQAPNGIIQSEIGKLAVRSRHSGKTEIGRVSITYRSNSIRDSLRAQVHAIPNTSRAFAVVSEIDKSGRPSWILEEHVCSNPSCNQPFTVTKNIQKCNICGSPKCPECGSCDCDLDKEITSCPICHMQYSTEEQRNPALHECF